MIHKNQITEITINQQMELVAIACSLIAAFRHLFPRCHVGNFFLDFVHGSKLENINLAYHFWKCRYFCQCKFFICYLDELKKQSFQIESQSLLEQNFTSFTIVFF